MSGSEGGDDRLRPDGGQFAGSNGSVVEEGAQSPGGRQMQKGETGCDDTPQHPEVAVTLADVVEEGGPDQIGAARVPVGHQVGALESMALVEHLLPPEERSSALAEPTGDPVLLARIEGTGTQGLKEAAGQVHDAPHQIISPAIQPVQSQMKESAPLNMKTRANRIRNPYCEIR